MNALPPAHEVQQAVRIAVEALVGKSPDILTVQIAVDPGDASAGRLLDHLIRAVCARGVFCGRRESSWQSGLQERLELLRITALNEEGVGIVVLWQHDAASSDASERQDDGRVVRRACCPLWLASTSKVR